MSMLGYIGWLSVDGLLPLCYWSSPCDTFVLFHALGGSWSSGVESGFLVGKEYWFMIYAMHDDFLFGVAQAQLILLRAGLNSCKSFSFYFAYYHPFQRYDLRLHLPIPVDLGP